MTTIYCGATYLEKKTDINLEPSAYHALGTFVCEF